MAVSRGKMLGHYRRGCTSYKCRQCGGGNTTRDRKREEAREVRVEVEEALRDPPDVQAVRSELHLENMPAGPGREALLRAVREVKAGYPVWVIGEDGTRVAALVAADPEGYKP